MQNQVFEPFQKVLVRLQEGEVWKCAFYDRKGVGAYHIVIGPAYDPTDGNILPYNDETKHLLGTKDDPAPKWEPKADDFVAVRQTPESNWVARRFIKKNGPLFRCRHESGVDTTCWKFCEPLRKHFNVPD